MENTMARKNFIIRICGAIFFIFFSVQFLFALTGREIMEKNDALKEPESAKSVAVMNIYRDGQLKETKEMEMISKKISGNDRVLVNFIKPTQIKFLTHSYKGKEDDQWLKTSSGQPKKIGSSDKGKPFVHSHLFYEDMSSREINDYSYSYLGDEKVLGYDCHKVEAVKTKGQKIYDKSVLYIRKTDFFAVKIDFYMKGKLLKILENHDIKTVSGIITPHTTIMSLPDGKGKTVIQIKSVQYNINILDTTFNKGSL
jgi:hypothetical protein